MNPMMIVQQLLNNKNIANNPTIQNAFKLMQQNDINGLQQIAENMCKQRGINLSDMQAQIKQKFGL